jgi:hypothetical protein
MPNHDTCYLDNLLLVMFTHYQLTCLTIANNLSLGKSLLKKNNSF